MICLLVSIYFLRQIRVADPAYADGLLKKIQSCVRGDNGSPTEDDPLFFSFPDRQNSLFMLAQASYRVYELLREERENLNGFNIVIGKAPVQRNAFRFFCESAIKTPSDERVWVIDPADVRAFEYFQLEQAGSLFRVTGIKKESILSPDITLDFWIRNGVCAILEGILEPYVSGSTTAALLFITGERHIGKKENALKAVCNLGPEDLRILTIRKSFPGENPMLPLATSVDPAILASAEDFLDVAEVAELRGNENAWRFILANPLRKEVSEAARKSFRKFYDSYVLLFGRSVATRSFPAVLFCEDVAEFPEILVEELGRIIGRCLASDAFLPICTSSGGLPSAFSGFSSRVIEVDPATAEEISAYIGQASDSVIAPGHLRTMAEAARGRIYAAQFSLLCGRLRRGSDVAAEGEEPPAFGPEDAPVKAFGLLDESSRALFYRISLSRTCVDLKTRKEFIYAKNPSRGETFILIQQLYQCGFIGSTRKLDVVFPEFEFLPDHAREESAAALEAEYAEFLMSRLPAIPFAFSSTAFDYVEGLGRKISPALRFAASLGDIRSGSGVGNSTSLRVYEALFRGNREGAKLALPVLDEEASRIAGNGDEGIAELIRAIDSYADRDMERALAHAKSALLRLQSADFSELYAFANRVMGLIMLATGHRNEALEYAEIAIQLSEKADDRFEQLYGILFEVYALYGSGNYSKAFRSVEKGRSVALSVVSKEWEILFDFLEGRFLFDLGDYPEARAALSSGLGICEEYGLPSFHDELAAWLCRVDAFEGTAPYSVAALTALPETAERLFFRAEALYLSQDLEGALSCVERAKTLVNVPRYYSPEFIGWADGFDILENRAISFADERSCLARLVDAFQDFLLGQKNDSSMGRSENELAVDSRASELDPYNHLRYLWRYLVLMKDPGSDSVDRMTILSKAFKYMQQRASGNDAIKEKNDFIYRNYWNLQLVQAARGNKLL
jgi:tetratricopeptide (TPR) repeat protein